MPTSPSCSTSARVPATPRITRQRSGSSATGATSPRVGISGASETYARQLEHRNHPRGHRLCRPVRPGCLPGTIWMTRSGPWANDSWNASPPICRIPMTRSGGCWHSSTTWGNATTRWSSSCRTTGPAQRAGKRAPSTRAGCRISTRPAREMYRRIDEIGGPLSHNNYPWGWTMAGNTPLKRWKREVHEGRCGRSLHRLVARRVARGPVAVFVGSSPMRSTCCRRCSNWSGCSAPETHRRHCPVAPRRDQLRLSAGRRGGAESPAGTPRSTSRCSAAGRSITTAGRR